MLVYLENKFPFLLNKVSAAFVGIVNVCLWNVYKEFT